MWRRRSRALRRTCKVTCRREVTVAGVTTTNRQSKASRDEVNRRFAEFAEGYQTGAIVKSPVPREDAGYAQGFDTLLRAIPC